MISARSALSCFNVSKLWYPVGEMTLTLSGTQSVRWRKRRWMPVAPSKRFWVPKRLVIPKEEEEEIKRLYNIYRTQMKAVRDHLRRENLRTSATSELASQHAAEEEEEHRQLMEFNRQENERVAALRENRLQKEVEADFARVIATKEKWEKLELEDKETALRIISETQELVKTFIQREELEKVIEVAIENPKDYNYAIDDDGYVYRGRKTRPDDTEEKEHLMSAGM